MALPPRVVLASSIAVYDADASGVVTEATPLEAAPARRDAYARAKIAQEGMLRDSGLRHTILRPGAIIGPGRVWNPHLGPVIGGVLMLMERHGEVPLVSLTDCARAFVLAAEMPGEGRALNILGRDRPTRARFVATLRQAGWPRHVLRLNWRLLLPLAWCLVPLGDRVPGLLRPAVLRARMRPVRYDIAAAKAALGWTPANIPAPPTPSFSARWRGCARWGWRSRPHPCGGRGPSTIPGRSSGQRPRAPFTCSRPRSRRASSRRFWGHGGGPCAGSRHCILRGGQAPVA
jgi:nucleoside-diphosphate-sugar epimerase